MTAQNTTNSLARKYNVVVKRGDPTNTETLAVSQGAGDRGMPLRIKVKAGARYEIQEELAGNLQGPDYIKVKHVGKDLHLAFKGGQASDVIFEDYYEVMPEGYNAIIGRAENGNFYEYIPEDPNSEGAVPWLKEGGPGVTAALGGGEVSPAGAAVGVFALSPMMLGAGAAAGVGLAAAGGGGGGGGGGGAPQPDPNQNAKVNIGAITEDNGKSGDFITNDSTLTYSGSIAGWTNNGDALRLELKDKAGKVVKTAVVTPLADGSWSWADKEALADGSYTLEATVVDKAGNVLANAARQPITIDLGIPAAVNDAVSDTEDILKISGDVSSNDTNKDGSETYALVDSAVGKYGSLELDPNGQWRYKVTDPTKLDAISVDVTEVFSYKLIDLAGNSSVGKLSVTLTAVNDAPVNTLPANINADEDIAVHISGLKVSDVDAGMNAITVTLSVDHGTLTAADSAGIVMVGQGKALLTLTGTVEDLNTLFSKSKGISYTSSVNFYGFDTFTMTTNDRGNTGGSEIKTDTDVIKITVNPVSDTPTGTDKTIDIVTGTGYKVGLEDFGFGDPRDTPSDAFEAVLLGPPTTGKLQINGATITASDTKVDMAAVKAGLLVFIPESAGSSASMQFKVVDTALANNVAESYNTLTFKIASANAPSGALYPNDDGLTSDSPPLIDMNSDSLLDFSVLAGSGAGVPLPDTLGAGLSAGYGELQPVDMHAQDLLAMPLIDLSSVFAVGQPSNDWGLAASVTESDYAFNVYQPPVDSSLQVLIDNHIAQSNVHLS